MNIKNNESPVYKGMMYNAKKPQILCINNTIPFLEIVLLKKTFFFGFCGVFGLVKYDIQIWIY